MLRTIVEDDSIRACVLSGKGKSFSSGADLDRADSHRIESIGTELADTDSISRLFRTLLESPKPIVCGVEGYAIGAGFLLAICCDLIVGGKSAQFSLPQVPLGIMPSYDGLGRLVQWVGRGRALEIGLTGRRLSADEAARIGILCRVCDDGEALQTAFELAKQLAALPPLSVRLARESLHDLFELQQLAATVAADTYRQVCLKGTSDSAEAHSAWREKRTPENRGM